MMTLDGAIKHAEEVAEEQDELCKRYDDASGYSRSHNESIRVADAKWCERCAKEHRQLAKWLKELKQLREQTKWIPVSERLPKERGVYIVTEKVFSVTDKEHTGGFNLMTEQVEFDNGKWRRASFYEVIAWKPLPKPYQAEKESE